MRTRTSHLSILLCLLLRFAPAGVWAQDEPAELSQLRSAYQRDVEFATRPIRDRYVSKLDLLKRSLGSRGDARAALAVQEEIDRSRQEGGDAGKFAGDWKITFNTGRTRHYLIKNDGTVMWDEENGQKQPPKSAKLVVQSPFAVLKLLDIEVERLSFVDNRLVVEHFFPKSTYPAGPPEMRGTAVNSAQR